MNHLNRLLYLFLILTSVACSKNSSDSTTTGTSVSIPSIQPPVSKATPVGLKGASSLMSYSTGEISTLSLAYTDLQQRFYGAGPTKIDNLLSAVDSRMSGINSRSSQDTHACLNATPVEYSMSILGTNQTAYFQCYEVMSDGTGGILFGKKDDSWYLYQNIGAGRSFAIVSPVANSTGDYTVEGWFSVGLTNTPNWYSGSYGVVHLKANSSTKNLEMAVAGIGFGYCGTQLKTDGNNLFMKGSIDTGSNGTTWSCGAVDTLCSSASDLSQSGSCGTIDNTTFELSALGVTSSGYGSGVTLDGTSSDSVHFGPAVSAISTISGVDSF